MSELLPFMKMSFPGVLKAKFPCRHKGQESSGSEVMGTNPNSHLRCLLWKQTLTKKWQTRRCDSRAKQTKNMCFVLGWVTYWEREGKSSSFVVYLQLFTPIWNQLASRDKNFTHFDEFKQYGFNNAGRNVLQQQSKGPDRGGPSCNNLPSKMAHYRNPK